jgi:tetratricopeptide (TPR) repeat protein
VAAAARLRFAAGRAGRPDLTQRLLAPLLASGTASREKPALAVLHAVEGPHADVRLQVILLQAELDTTPAAAADDQLRLHAALAAAYSILGSYPLALSHGRQELALRHRLQHPDHPATLTTRNNIAGLTEQLRHASRDDHERLQVQLRKLADDAATAGDTATAISCCEQLVAAAEQALGPQDIRLTGYLRRVAGILKAAGQDTLAIEALTRAVAINDRYGSETTEAIGDLRGLAALQQRTGLHQEAAQYLDKARDIEAHRSTGRA